MMENYVDHHISFKIHDKQVTLKLRPRCVRYHYIFCPPGFPPSNCLLLVETLADVSAWIKASEEFRLRSPNPVTLPAEGGIVQEARATGVAIGFLWRLTILFPQHYTVKDSQS